ncbi:chromosome segregation protein SMC [Vagococcus silagei]|uniref:Chromosome partition protein Smc n=1 Tax=Vagococcus silagei TaxID=2508885 RepID=A0A4S3B3I6_9ENTE|nr:chromosome segregation protein SMC [Vagococcus silagei]THB61008.1 chromosome segregation protein SMC [Vagococcus silagei]
MYLKRLEIAGFKSFADRTVIEFNKGLTAVVGPNGSGKSNIIEAVRWALGEQSAKNLRGGKMPDVIFAGSSSRSPLNVAEVTMVLDNSEQTLPIDYQEVSITRRLNRSGDSDFFINKSNCRLKDIVQLFMDSGLGKESFSIISQGKVEEIFNSKPEDRRGIFEEAAGVLKYKTRKKEAERRLFETEDNLDRLQDIILELESQLEPLKEQSLVARQYLEMKEELTQVDVSVTVEEINRFKTVWEEQSTALTEINQKIKMGQQQISELEQSSQQLKAERDELNDTTEKKQADLLALTTAYEQLEGQKKVYDERQKNTKITLEQHQQSIAVLKQKLVEVSAQLDGLKQEQREKQSVSHVLEKRISELELELSKVSRSVKEQLEDLRSDYVEVMQQQTNINNDLKYLERQYTQEMTRSQKDIQQFDEMTNSENESLEKQEQLQKEEEQLKLEMTQVIEQYQTNKIRFDEVERTTQISERQMYEALKILQQAQAREKTLQDVKESYTGFYQGVRAVLKAKNQLTGIVGAVAELITVPKEYRLAIETALGGAAQFIVTEAESDARAGISYLKQQRAGRATFLPLTTIKRRDLNASIKSRVQNETGFLGIASELVTYSNQVSSVVSNLLGMTLIAKDLNSANALAKSVNYQYRVVSLDGDVMNPGGSMTGGATKRGANANLFSQAEELTELQKQVKQMEQLYQTKEKTVADLKQEFEQLKTILERDRARGEELRFTLQTTSNQLEQLTMTLERQSKERAAFEFEKKELQRFLENYQEEKEQLEEALQELTERRTQLDELMNQQGNLEETNQKRKELLQKELADKQAQFAVVTEQLEHIRARIKEKRAQQEETQQEVTDLERLLSSTDSEQNISTEQAEQIIAKMSVDKELLAELQNTIFTLKEKREQVYLSVKQADEHLMEQNKALQYLIDNKTDMEVNKNRAGVSLDHSLEYLQSEYQLTFEAAREQFPLVLEFTQAKSEIKKLKQKMTALGAVNLQSIEQYDEVMERFEFLTVQRNDLLTAKEELFTTMDEMDALVIEKFHDVFCDIRAEFQVVFPKMFAGGHADLELTDPTDLLNTGIEIIACPPGKKLQQLSLLSGGERALTAIALLFAIIQARPVPFCILDEVEAALDDANVARFGHYLKEFGDERQFIVITHRKGTMEAANRLYGVTMQESGVSKMVSVRLEDYEEPSDN